MPPKTMNTCTNCKRKITNRDYLKCNVCKCIFDLDCAHTSEKLFDIMKKESKSKWNCNSCKNKKSGNKPNKSVYSSTPKAYVNTNLNKESSVTYVEPDISKSASSNANSGIIQSENNYDIPENKNNKQPRDSLDYITMRKKYPTEGIQNTSLPNIESPNSSSLSEQSWPNRSLPDLSSRQNKEIENLQDEISNLKLKLYAAENEIDNLILEKSNMEKIIASQARKINNLLNVCSSSTINHSSTLSSAKKKKKKDKSNSLDIHKMTTNKDMSTTTKNASIIGKEAEKKHDDIKETRNMYQDEKLDLELGEKCSDPTIYILGGQQCSGMASALCHSRRKTKYGKYKITSTIKPNAPIDKILNTTETVNADKNDVVIINIGENDKNPTKICAELSFFLKLHCKTTLIIIGVQNNAYLNETNLNATLKMYCNVFNNCKFLDLSDIDRNDVNFMYKICYKLNIIIDTMYYDKKYLGYNKLVVKNNNKPLQLPPIKTKICRKGTIPYYFKPEYKKVSLYKSNCSRTRIVQKTITDYFLKPDMMKPTQHTENTFFRK